MTLPTGPTVAVAVITYKRPDYLRTCLEHLVLQDRPADEIVVVDASPDTQTRLVVRDFPGVRYVRNDRGAGTMATSRGLALAATSSDVIAFVDDDAYADPDWLEALLLPYADPEVAAVGGRARNGFEGEKLEGADRIGMLLPSGQLTGFFAADPGRDIDVDHLLGANMSLRREVIDRLGGIRDYYPGTCLREESDMFLRVGLAGARMVYTPSAIVRHVAGPYARGARFDLRYEFYGQRNHVVLFSRTFGLHSPMLRRYLSRTAPLATLDEVHKVWRRARDKGRRVQLDDARVAARGLARAALRSSVRAAGLLAGLRAAVVLERAEGSVPEDWSMRLRQPE